uniref:Maelstrom domain-containing protein n=1 Tax=Anopheles minimus TaxID=112268 RepID=A0A182W4I6_9DIPT
MRKDAFFFFVVDYKRRLETRAKKRLFRKLDEVVPLAREAWLEMNSGQRRPFVLQAKEYQEDGECLSKYQSLVRDVSMLEEARCAQANKTRQMKSLIDKLVGGAESRHELGNQDFYFISILHFGRTFIHTYQPAELAIVKYSLKCGIKEQLHLLINPGVISLCDEYSAMQHSKNTHALPIPPDALGLAYYDEIAEMVLEFTKAKEHPTVLFTNAQNVSIVESMLLEILEDHIDANTLYVSSLEELFYRLKQATKMNPLSFVPSMKMVQNMLNEDIFSNTIGISCQYHESRQLFMHCALSQCVRWAYTVSANCCSQMCIELIPGKHIPMDTSSGSGSDTSDMHITVVHKPKKIGKRGCSRRITNE